MEKLVSNGISYTLINTNKNIYDNTIGTILANIDELDKDEYRKKQILEYSRIGIPSSVHSIINMISQGDTIRADDAKAIYDLCKSISTVLSNHSWHYWKDNGTCGLTCQAACQTTCQLACQSCYGGTCHDKHCGGGF